MRLFITGAAGFIGFNFLHYWLRTHPEDTLTAYDILTDVSNKRALSELVAQEARITFVLGDILDYAELKKSMFGHDVVVHFAAESHVDSSIHDPAVFVRTNVEGTMNVLRAAKENGNLRTHYVSTDEVFGEYRGELFTEETRIAPRNPYSASKAGGGHMAMAYYNTYGLPVTISNGVNTYGPYQYPNKLIPKMIINALSDLPLTLYGNGTQTREWVFVEDHCSGVATILENGVIGERYIIGTGVVKENVEIVKTILELTQKDESLIVHVEDRLGHDQSYQTDASKLKNIGWEPKMSFEEGLQETVAWYQQHASLYN